MLHIQIHAYIRNIIYTCVCVWHLNRCKTSVTFLFSYSGESPGSRGGRWPTKTHSRDPWKRTCRTSMLHLVAFKSQLVATVVLYIYIIYIYISYQVRLRFYGAQFPTDHCQWSSSFLVCVCNICIDVQLPLLAGGLEPICLSSPTKLWHFGGYRWMSGLINHLYLHCFSQSLWQGAKPRTPAVFSFLHGCRNLRVSSTLFQTWSTWYSFRIWRRAKPRTLSRSTLGHCSNCNCMWWDSVPNGSL